MNSRRKSEASLALYGGSFDPVHCAHLQVARFVLDELPLDKVIFIPAARSPLKADTAVADDVDRLEMLHLATADEPRFEVDPCEIERGGTSYTVDTVRHFRSRYTNSSLYWIIGADQLELLPRWNRIDTLAALVTFVVLHRPGHSGLAPPVDGLKMVEVEAALMPHSSSAIRRQLREGRLDADWLPPSVEAFISARGLYTR